MVFLLHLNETTSQNSLQEQYAYVFYRKRQLGFQRRVLESGLEQGSGGGVVVSTEGGNVLSRLSGWVVGAAVADK